MFDKLGIRFKLRNNGGGSIEEKRNNKNHWHVWDFSIQGN
jgi:hypothetical protein